MDKGNLKIAPGMPDLGSIERLFRLWKETDKSTNGAARTPGTMLRAFYGKLAAMLIQEWLIHEG
jgi:hypothetical protein